MLSLASLQLIAGPGVSADVKANKQLYSKWKSAVEAGDINGYIANLNDNIRLIPPGTKDIKGIKAYEAFLVPVFQTATYKIITKTPHDIQVIGDWAFVRYDYEVRINLKNVDKNINQEGALTQPINNSKYFDVLKRQQDGSWKVFTHMWNNNSES